MVVVGYVVWPMSCPGCVNVQGHLVTLMPKKPMGSSRS